MSTSDQAQSNGSNNVVSSNEYFRSIGQQVDQVAPATNGASDNDDIKPVEEIQSLCMNCHDNVSRVPLYSSNPQDRLELTDCSRSRALLAFCSPRSLISAR